MTVVLSRSFNRDVRVDGSLKARAWDFTDKLTTDPDGAGLDLKMPKNCVDRRVRTARVDQSNRAVLFVVGETAGEQTFVLAAIKPHDEAYAFAQTLTLSVNPANGIMEAIHREAVTTRAEAFRQTSPPAQTDPVLPFTEFELVGVGIDAEVAGHAVRVIEQDALLDLAADLPTWQQQALLDLATGSSLDDVRERFAMTPVAPASAQTDEALLAALDRPATQLDLVRTDDADLRRILEGDFQDWRVFLHPDQRDVVHRYRNAPFRLNGGAGTGKTVVALHRAVALACELTHPSDRVLLTTFTRNLAHQLAEQIEGLAPRPVVQRIEVLGVDALARTVVTDADGDAPSALSDTEEADLWDESLRAVEGLPESLGVKLTPAFLAAEYRAVILAGTEHTREAYFAESRRGRRVRLNRLEKNGVWKIVDAFERRLAARGRTTFARIAARAADVAAPRYAHAVVDEGQDLHAAHWRMIRALVPPGPNDMFICEDGHQQIYGERLVLSRFGIETRGRSRRLTLNYRTTAENLRFAIDVVRPSVLGVVLDLDGEEDTVQGYRSALHGPRPVARGFFSEQDERTFVTQTVRSWLEKSDSATVAVITRRSAERDAIRTALVEAGVPVHVLGSDSSARPGVALSTMHRAKGTEFESVVIAGVREGVLPSSYVLSRFPEADRAAAEARERSLFYVACSRAREQVVVTWTGEPSPFIPI